jgi:hypothetical protein
LLGELSDSQDRIFALSFHVDYWNRLGWIDPFSQKVFSDRQRRYAQVLNDRRVYTPEMVVNGKDGFIGSDRLRAEHRVEQALQTNPGFTLDLTVSDGYKKDRVQISYRLDAVPEKAVLNVALVEKSVEILVPRGENAGRTLHHHHTVREWVTVKADTAGAVRLVLPGGLEWGDVEIIGFVQDKETMHILAANRAGNGRE